MEEPKINFIWNKTLSPYFPEMATNSSQKTKAELLKGLEDVAAKYSRRPIAIVAREDVYRTIKTLCAATPHLPVYSDPAADSVAMRQTEECMVFYDQESLTLYLNRREDPLAWVRHCCDLAGIPYPVEEDPGRQAKPEPDAGYKINTGYYLDKIVQKMKPDIDV